MSGDFAQPDPSSLFGAPGLPSQWTQFDLLQLSQYFLGVGGGIINGDLVVTTAPQSPQSVATVSSVATGTIAPQPGQPTAVTLTTGVDAITSIGFINVSWAADPLGLAQDWEVRFRKQGTSLYTYQRAVNATNSRCQNVIPNVIYEVGVQAIGRTGVQSGYGADSTVTTASAAQPPPEVSLVVDKLQAGTLSAAVILSGNISTANSGKRVVMDSTGLRLYNAAGAVVVDLDAGTGSGSFTGTITASTISGATITGTTITGGTIQTAASGKRLVIDPALGVGEVTWIDPTLSANGNSQTTAATVTGNVSGLVMDSGSVAGGAHAGVGVSPQDGATPPYVQLGGATGGNVQLVGTTCQFIMPKNSTGPVAGAPGVTGPFGFVWVDGSGNLRYQNTGGTAGIVPAVSSGSSSLVQSGTSTPTLATGAGTVTFPAAFPTACDAVVIVPINGSSANVVVANVNTISTTGFTVMGFLNGSPRTGTMGFYWMAFGH